MSRMHYPPLEQRCLAAGVLPWRVNWATLAIEPPAVISPHVAAWCARRSVIEAVTHAAKYIAGNGGAIAEVSEGVVAAAVGPASNHGLVGVAFTPAGLIDDADALKPFTHADAVAIERTIKLLNLTAADLARSAREGKALAQFSDRLEQAFEENNLLFRLARLLKIDGDARQQFTVACEQIQLVMPFKWLAVRFRSDPQFAAMGLSGVTIAAGKPGPVINELEAATDEVQSGASARVLRPGDSALAVISGGEVSVDPILHAGRLVGVLFGGGKVGADAELSSEEMQFMTAVAELLGNFHEKASRFHEQQSMFMGTVGALTAAIDAKDPYTRGHSERVGLLASQMAASLGLGEILIEQYQLAGVVHDVGKIGVSEAVLRKAGKLTDEEFAEIKRHPEVGHHILRGIPPLRDVLPGVLHHHERWDGRGYPHKLAGEAIPLIARVLALADTFDAMCSSRSYRAAISRELVLVEIRKCAGTQFDPALVPLFVSLDFSRFDAMLNGAARQAA